MEEYGKMVRIGGVHRVLCRGGSLRMEGEGVIHGSCRFQIRNSKLRPFLVILRPKLSKFKTYGNKNVAHTIK